MRHPAWFECDYCYNEFTPSREGQTSCQRCLNLEEGSGLLFDPYVEEEKEEDAQA